MAGTGWLNRRRGLGKRHLRWMMDGRPGAGIEYLYFDDFSTPESAPLASPRTCEPGPGSLTIVDTAATLYIADGLLYWPVETAVGNPRFHTAGIPRACGLGTFTKIQNANERYNFGWSDDTSKEPDHLAYRQVASAYMGIKVNGTICNVAAVPGAGQINGVILRPTGAWWLCSYSGVWKLLFVYNQISDNLAAGIGMDTTPVFETDYFKVVQLPSPWNRAYGIATERVASPAGNETISMEADGLVEFTWQAVTAETLDILVRRTDDDNCWIIRATQAGSTLKIIEKVTGVETERSSASQTLTNGTSYRFVVSCDTQDIRAFVDVAAKGTYGAATFNQAATGVKVTKGGTDLVSWPRYPSGSALSILEAV